jgi:hypothetical protein
VIEAGDREHAGPATRRGVVVLGVGVGVHEGEGRAAQDHADEHHGQRDVQGGGDRGEGQREADEEEHDDEDQPHMVGLPDRPDRVVDEVALVVGAGPRGEHQPGAAAEVGARAERVDHQRGQHDAGDRQLGAHVGSSAVNTLRVSSTTTVTPRIR